MCTKGSKSSFNGEEMVSQGVTRNRSPGSGVWAGSCRVDGERSVSQQREGCWYNDELR